MNIEIIKESKENGHYIEAACGKTTALVGRSAAGYISVVCKNASHRVWRGLGRTFGSVEEAVESYKKPEMKAIIRLLEA